MAAYCASKWALEAMTEALAGEMKTFGVRVALVEPGVIDTSMAAPPHHCRRLEVSAKASVMRQLLRPVAQRSSSGFARLREDP